MALCVEEELSWLNLWYKSQCAAKDSNGIKLQTLDNPAWYIEINLKGTECEGHSFSPIACVPDENNWHFCYLKEGQFEAICGPCSLAKVLYIFRHWVEGCGKVKSTKHLLNHAVLLNSYGSHAINKK